MNDLTRATIGLFAVMAAPGALDTFAALSGLASVDRRRLIGAASLLALACLALIAAVNGPVLDWLAISEENFQLAAGIVMLPLAFRLLWTGETWPAQATSPIWKTWSLFCGPVPAVLMLSYSARFGFGTALGAATIALVASAAVLLAGAWLALRLAAGRSSLGRFNGAVIIVLAIELMVDGVQSV